MKIKTWLLLTYLLLMILPLVALYGLYMLINDYYQDKNVEEYFEKWNVVTDLKEALADSKFYRRGADYGEVDALVSDQLMITLYSANGRILYSSNPLTAFGNYERKQNVYQHLYELKQNYETFVYKEPVYEDGAMKGIYKITLARTEWTEQVNNKMVLVGIGLVTILLLLYGSVLFLLHRKLNKPAQQLIQQMRAFANGEEINLLWVKKDELGELTENFQLMQQQILATRKKLEQEERQKAFMIASLSHDLKTPLTSIQAYTESLLAGKLEQEQLEYLQIIGTKSEYMKQLVDDLMMFTLLQSPTYEMELLEVDGGEFFEMLLTDYEQVGKEKGFEMTTFVEVEGNYFVNPKQLMRVVDNLLANAWNYTNSGGFIQLAAFEQTAIPAWCQTLTLSKEGAYIVIQNSGETLSEEQCQQMFEPLYQIDEARTHIGQRGAGLGLSIAQQIIEKHQGTIYAVSEHNKITVIIWLPKEKEQ